MRIFLFFLLVALQAHAQQGPNIIYIMSDDHDADAISAYNDQLIQTPNIDRLAKEGTRFTRAFVGNSICAPARATLLTGQHSHKNGIRNNFTAFDGSKNTFPKLLQQAGYQTSVIGKWHLRSYPTGFDYWRILPGMGQYYDTRMIKMNGDTIIERGYSTDVITDDAIDWLNMRDKSKPFSLLLHHKAPHRYFFPSLKWLEVFHTKTFPEPSTFYADTMGRGSAWQMQTMSILSDMQLCSDLKVDPQYLMDIPEYKPDSAQINYYKAIMRRVPDSIRERFKEIYAERGKILRTLRPQGKELLKYKYQWYMQDYLACIAAVDENVGRVLDYLDENDLAKNTIVIYTSDQGFYLGENGWFDKRFMYDVSMHTPLLARWPGHIPANSINNNLVQNIDFAPTILDFAGLKTPGWMQGVSLKDIMTGEQEKLSRKNLYYHYYEYAKDHTVIPHLGIRGERYKLIYFYTVNEWEFYDLEKDPTEQHNLINEPLQKANINQMKIELKNLQEKYDDKEIKLSEVKYS